MEGEYDLTRLFSSRAARLVCVDDDDRVVPAIVVSQDLGDCIDRAIVAEREYKSIWTKINATGMETAEKKAQGWKKVERLDEELANLDEVLQKSSSPPTAQQHEERRSLASRVYSAREDLHRLFKDESTFWIACKVAEQECRDAWEDVGVLLLSAWLRAGLTQPHYIDNERLPRGEKRGITRENEHEPPIGNLRLERENVKGCAEALRQARTRLEHMCHHYSSWAPWKDGVAAEFRDGVVRPAFLAMLQDERTKLEDAKIEYRRALARAWREKLPDAELDYDIGPELKSNDTRLLDVEDADFIHEGPINVLDVWRRQIPDCTSSEPPLSPIEERGSKEDIQPFESKSKGLTDLGSTQGTTSIGRTRRKLTVENKAANREDKRYSLTRKHQFENSRTISEYLVNTGSTRAVSRLASTRSRHPRELRLPKVMQFRTQANTTRYQRRPVTDFFKKPKNIRR
jgi:hypothetical protein